MWAVRDFTGVKLRGKFLTELVYENEAATRDNLPVRLGVETSSLCRNVEGKSCTADACDKHGKHAERQVHGCRTYTGVAWFVVFLVLTLAVPQFDPGRARTVNALSNAATSRARSHHTIVTLHCMQASATSASFFSQVTLQMPFSRLKYAYLILRSSLYI